MNSKQQTIVILGAGVSGLHCALDLAKQLRRQLAHRIVLIDRLPYHTLHSSLYHVLTLQAHQETVCLPLATVLANYAIEFVQDTVTAVNPIHQTIKLHTTGTIAYDYLVVALGSLANDYIIPGLTDRAYFFNSFNDALRLRKAVLTYKHKDQKIRLVIGGAGLAGVELAGTFATDTLLNSRCKIDVIEGSSHIMPNISHSLSDTIVKQLKQLNVDVYCGQPIVKVTSRGIILENHRTVPYDIFVWAGGIKPNPLIKAAGFEVDRSDRALVRSTLQAHGYNRVYIIGDSAAFLKNNKLLSQMNPYAAGQGIMAAGNIARQIKGQSPRSYHPSMYATIITLGRLMGYISFGPLHLAGRSLVAARDIAELWYLAGLLPLRAAWAIESNQKRSWE